MIWRLTYGFMVVALLALFSGCASTTQPTGPAAPSGADKEPGAKAGEAQPRTSLDDLRRGQPPATPAAGPLKEVYFDFDRYDIRADARETLKANAGWLKANPAARVEIEGHADDRGTNEYNLALGAKRAQSTKDYLATLGIQAGRLSTISYGEELPVCKEQTEECWQRNRRARFVVITGKPAS